MNEVNEPINEDQAVAEPDEPMIPAEPAPPITSRFLFVDVAALRAKQLRRGARPRVSAEDGPMPHKAERLAMEEVRRGRVLYDVPERRSSHGEDAEGEA